MFVEVSRAIALIVIVVMLLVAKKYLTWINHPEWQLLIGIGLIVVIILDSITGILLTIAFAIAFAKTNTDLLFGNISNNSSSSSSTLPPYVTPENLAAAQTNIINPNEFNVGYKGLSGEGKNVNVFGAQGLDPVSPNSLRL